jgi:hypothetical protein
MAYTAIDDPEAHFQAKLYTGNDSTQSITFDGSTDMQPDLIWIKSRTNGASHVLTDAVRGVNSQLYSEGNWAAGTYTNMVTAFGSDGWTMGSNAQVNGAQNYVAWCWKAGTTSGIAGSPSITPTSYSFNATSGCSIIKYDGTGSAATLPHGLGVAPKVVIVKRTDDANDWLVYHEKVDATEFLRLDNNQAETTSSTAWNDTAPTSTLFSIGDRNEVNNSSGNYVAYCFAEKQGYSKFGSYTGNGSTSGPMIWLGFRPAYVMIKKTNSTGNWCIYDNRREGYNPDNDELYADLTNSLGDVEYVDILSNGFKLTSTTSATNNSGDTYVYFAFAHSPFVNSNGVPTNAR